MDQVVVIEDTSPLPVSSVSVPLAPNLRDGGLLYSPHHDDGELWVGTAPQPLVMKC